MIFFMHECEEVLGYTFKDKVLLRACFTHSSYAHEHGGEKNNERLEFFGDSILGFVTAEYLMAKYPDLDEGRLTAYKQQLVSREPLSRAIEKSGLDQFLMYGEGEKKNSKENHQSANENLYEAIVAGIYIDGGIEEVKKFVKRTLFSKINITAGKKDKATDESAKLLDHKGKLQEIVQKRKLGNIVYVVKNKVGPDHDPMFTIAVTVDGKELATAKGRKKSDAEKQCAKLALEKIEKEKANKNKTKKKQTVKTKNKPKG